MLELCVRFRALGPPEGLAFRQSSNALKLHQLRQASLGKVNKDDEDDRPGTFDFSGSLTIGVSR